MNLEDLIIIIRKMRNTYDNSFVELSKQKKDDLTESINQIRDLAVFSGAVFALDKVLELVNEDKEGNKE